MAAEMAVASPLLDDISVEGDTGVLINIVGGPDLKMREIQEAASLVQEMAHEDANIIFGASIDEALGENVKVTVIATGFEQVERMASLNEGARLSMPAPQTVPSMQYAPQATQYIPQASQHMSHPSHASQRPVFQQQQPASRTSENAPAFSSRRIPAPADSRVVPASTRVPTRERATSNFPAFDTDWDVPAFQRKGQ
jgi:cell division protein FtsZ